jgi:hypothetical protein
MIIPNHDFTARERTACELLATISNVRSLLNVGMQQISATNGTIQKG